MPASPARDWASVARDVAAEFAASAAARDRAGVAPVAEVDRLRDAGLLTLLVPAEAGGAGQGWPEAHAVVRAVGAADASLGHLLGYHQLQLWRTGLAGDTAQHRRLEAETVRRGWFWAGASNPRENPLRLIPVAVGTGFRLDGRKAFATGARLADRLVVSAVRQDTGAKLTFALDARAPGVTHLDDWDNMGQRSSASGSVEFHDVAVGADDVLAEQPADDEDGLRAGEGATSPRLTLPQLGFQLVLSHLHVAIAEGALAEAAGYTRTVTRPWPAGGAARAVEDHHVLAAYGALVARTAAAGALADRATEAFAAADARGDGLGWAERGELGLAVSAAKVVSTEVVLDVTSRVFELTGARATAARHGLDRYWRDARTLTLHDPVAYKAEELGAHHLTGALPAVTGYS